MTKFDMSINDIPSAQQGDIIFERTMVAGHPVDAIKEIKGGPYFVFANDFLNSADGIRMDNLYIYVGGAKFFVIGHDLFFDYTITCLPKHAFFIKRLLSARRILAIIKARIIATLEVWNLAYTQQGVHRQWRDIGKNRHD